MLSLFLMETGENGEAGGVEKRNPNCIETHHSLCQQTISKNWNQQTMRVAGSDTQ
jgi:hypothetical protein